MGNQSIQSLIDQIQTPVRIPQIQMNQIRQQNVCQFHGYSSAVQYILNQKKYYTNKISNSSSFKIIHDGVYQGNLNQNNQPQGFGKITNSNGSVFIGQFKNGKPNGNGLIVLPNGYYYQGDVVNGEAYGKGTFVKPDYYSYQGDFAKNKYSGQGKQQCSSSQNTYNFEGDFKNGKRVYGKLVWSDQQKKNFEYIGDFNDQNEFHGHGTLTSQLGTYKGQFRSGKKNGKGQFFYYHGVYYDGNYKNDEKQGYGEVYNDPGTQFQNISPQQQKQDKFLAFRGQMKNNIPEGKGQCWDDKFQSIVYCVWQNGQKQPFIQLKQ